MVTTVLNEDTGEERKRLINKGRWKGYGPATITFDDPNVPILLPANIMLLIQNDRSLRVHHLRSSKLGIRSTRIF